ncbi:LOB domain-containing protein 24 [Elaeis guineensis]|uniref:LOB domain-containing protein 25 n=1 Tax=Elaeis guineensis var. tenera TaxID=51953 RepID=A0A6I9QNV4_ELAGV|nr:LOB domain-containing protein 25 [Elaeis guineensis]
MDSQARAIAKPDPCAACRLLHRKCSPDCMLAPYFPTDHPEKFGVVHKVFGASNVIKMLQMVEESRREDAVKSMVYEAQARLKSPVYGSTSAIFYLQKCVEDLEDHLRETRAQLLDAREQRDQLLSVLTDTYHGSQFYHTNDPVFDDASAMRTDTNMIHVQSAGENPMNYYQMI